ncbi:hexosaminidase D-like isoform X2 [Procambarus clarkii]|uniref:hexosaminidase D-like isoform X2 n=2 Tax=Procambarus clarkii TaxID=6728 RepID=UPI001E670028|nr:hexosaminidase D-like [Procambarus clarkii]
MYSFNSMQPHRGRPVVLWTSVDFQRSEARYWTSGETYLPKHSWASLCVRSSMEVLRAWFGRAGVGAWRSRKQVVWAACVLVTVGVVYLQYAPGGPLDHPSAPRHRALNTLYTSHERDGHGQGSADSAHVQHVKFVTGSDAQQPGEWPRHQEEQDNRVEHQREDWTHQNENVINEEAIPSDPAQAQHRLAVEVLQRRVAERKAQDQQAAAVPGAVMLPQQDPPPGGSWGGGQYRYNPYGEPVYGRTDRPIYIPPHRVVHFDLKGAPPKMSAVMQLLPWIAGQGATAVLLEYEDMFPWRGRLAQVAAKNHYSRKQIANLVTACRNHGLEVIPLVQTFGHLEFALKHERFSHLREVPELPQALCPSLNESLWLVHSMVDQVMSLHPGARYLHIGCDEVYQIGECEKCRLVLRETLFLQHVEAVAKYVRKKYAAIPLIWDDMLRHVSESAMQEAHLGELVEPMVWVYAEDVYRFVQPSVWTKYSQVFSRVWAASAFKGAFGEQLTVPNVRRHLDNNLNWLDVMASEASKFTAGFRGIVLTGWQRYDHFAVLCELLPASLPSLAVNLIAVSHGYFNSSAQGQLYQALNCMQTPKYQTWLNLDGDPYLWDKFSWCFFPGAQVFKVTARLDATRRDVDSYIERVTRSRAWITDYNRRHNYSSPMRVDEDLEELPARLHAVTLLMKTAREALAEWYDDWTVGEWLEQHVWPLLKRLQTLQREAESMKAVRYWPARPLPLLPELAAFGISDPTPSNGQSGHDTDGGGGRT